MVDIEHDEAGGDGVGRFARTITREAACVRSDDRQLTFETGKFLGVLTVEELDLVADVLHTWVAHGLLDLGPEDRRWSA